MGDKFQTCPHCGWTAMIMKQVSEDLHGPQEDWVCTNCGYIGLEPEDPMSYVMPPAGASKRVFGGKL